MVALLMKKELSLTHGGNLFDIERNFGIKKENIIDFSGNLNPLGVPNSIKKILKDNIDIIGFYPDPDYISVKNAISKYVNLDSSYVTLGNGATELISKTIRFLAPKKALTINPTYSEYEKEINFIGGTLDFVDLKEENDFNIDINNLIEKFQDDYNLLVLCNPNNPTSSVLTCNEIKQILDAAVVTNTFVIVDETYVEFCENLEQITCTRLINEYNNLFIIRGISKFFGTPGLRLGYGLTSNSKLLEQLNIETDPWSINIFASIVGENVFKDIEYIHNSRELMKSETEYLYHELRNFNSLKVYRPNTNFILCKIKNKPITGTFISEQLIKNSILIRDTKNVKGLGDSYFRVCILSHEHNKLLIELLHKIID